MSISITPSRVGISNGNIRYAPGQFGCHILVNTSAGTMDPITITNVTFKSHIDYPTQLVVAGIITASYSHEPPPLSDAKRLAIAVLSGDECAALLLADEVQLNYLRR